MRVDGPPDRKVLAIDFDGVLHNWKDRLPNYMMGRPFPQAQQSMQELKRDGYELIIFTVRAQDQPGADAVRNWLDYFEIPYDCITAIKPKAAVYLDDHAVRFHTWYQARSDIKRLTAGDGTH